MATKSVIQLRHPSDITDKECMEVSAYSSLLLFICGHGLGEQLPIDGFDQWGRILYENAVVTVAESADCPNIHALSKGEFCLAAEIYRFRFTSLPERDSKGVMTYRSFSFRFDIEKQGLQHRHEKVVWQWEQRGREHTPQILQDIQGALTRLNR